MNEGPFTTEFDTDLDGVVRREIVTYRIKDGGIQKECAVRTYYNEDYNDSKSTIPLGRV